MNIKKRLWQYLNFNFFALTLSLRYIVSFSLYLSLSFCLSSTVDFLLVFSLAHCICMEKKLFI